MSEQPKDVDKAFCNAIDDLEWAIANGALKQKINKELLAQLIINQLKEN